MSTRSDVHKICSDKIASVHLRIAVARMGNTLPGRGTFLDGIRMEKLFRSSTRMSVAIDASIRSSLCHGTKKLSNA
jgi:hypothetical protein